ncbi:sphingosine kinase [Xylariales sp. PMI_506]|nr:sphingosine kinase [Xylariales sp. PMI_506]
MATQPEATPVATEGTAQNEPVPAPKEMLYLAKGVSLVLSGDSLIVKDKAASKKQRSNVCGVPIGSSPSQLSITFFNVLWAELTDNSHIVIDYATVSKTRARPSKLIYALGDTSVATATAWIEELLTLAYGSSLRRKRAKVLVNPFAGPGGADRIWSHEVRPLFEAARMVLDVTRTSRRGEAIDICEKLDLDAYDVVIPCSGDGLPYEVFNGLGKRPDARKALHQMAVAHIPAGSGNALSININGSHLASLAALVVIKGVRTPVDLMSVTQGDKRLLSFLSQSFGIIAECDLGTENMRWMGPVRFDVGVVQRIATGKTWPCELAVKTEIVHKHEIKSHFKKEFTESDHTVRKAATTVEGESVSSDADSGEGLPPLKYGTVNDKLPSDWETATHDKLINFYCGNMGYMAPKTNMFPAALPNDGLMDLTLVGGDVSRVKCLELMTSIESGHYFDNPLLKYSKVAAYRLTPKHAAGYISIDGEAIPFEPFQVEVHQGLGTLLSRDGKYAAEGPKGWEAAHHTPKQATGEISSSP